VDEKAPPGPFGIRIGRRGTFLDWLTAIGCALVLALLVYNAIWQAHLNRKEAQSKREWEQVWSKIAPERRPRPYVPDRRFRVPFAD
jgi:type II secretory pathway component PulL